MKSKLIVFISLAFILGSPICRASELGDAIQYSYQLEAEKKWAQSLEVLARKYKKYPNDYFLNLRLAWLFRILGNYENAKLHYMNAFQIYPRALDPKIGLYFLNVENQKFFEAKKEGEELLNKYPTQTLIVNSLVPIFLEENEFEKALRITNQELEIFPTDLNLLHFKITCLEKLNKPEKAKLVQEQILTIHSPN